ncbi:hypothetical protein Csa_001790 [Cucumis sativus]|nr:hypothetical protein Csa_001790 [Cucumis sativus]
MRSWMICVVFISMVVMFQNVEADRKYLKFVDCNQPKPPPFCGLLKSTQLVERGCSALPSICRGSGSAARRPNP